MAKMRTAAADGKKNAASKILSMCSLVGDLLRFEFGRERFGRLCDCGRRDFEVETADFEVVKCLAILRQLELAGDEARVFKLLQVQMQQWPADAKFPRKLANVVASARCKCAQ